mgnify:CR=1 FL=1
MLHSRKAVNGALEYNPTGTFFCACLIMEYDMLSIYKRHRNTGIGMPVSFLLNNTFEAVACFRYFRFLYGLAVVHIFRISLVIAIWETFLMLFV